MIAMSMRDKLDKNVFYMFTYRNCSHDSFFAAILFLLSGDVISCGLMMMLKSVTLA